MPESSRISHPLRDGTGRAGSRRDVFRRERRGLDHPTGGKAPHFSAKTKRGIHFFLNGGPSHVDTFDPKPALDRYHGKILPGESLKTERPTGAAFRSPFAFSRHGRSGIEISEIFPHIAQSADELCVIRSMHADVPNHEPSLMLMNCGEARLVRPSVGSWVAYGLGTENQNLPAFISMCPGGYPIQESQNWQAGFLPGVFQGTYIDTQHRDLEKLINPHFPALQSSPKLRQAGRSVSRAFSEATRRKQIPCSKWARGRWVAPHGFAAAFLV